MQIQLISELKDLNAFLLFFPCSDSLRVIYLFVRQDLYSLIHHGSSLRVTLIQALRLPSSVGQGLGSTRRMGTRPAQIIGGGGHRHIREADNGIVGSGGGRTALDWEWMQRTHRLSSPRC